MMITFHGGVREVGGSCTLIEAANNRVALDYGIKPDQGLSYNFPKDLDAIVVSHAHLDHAGNLLTMADRNTVMIGSEATRDVTAELLSDLIKVQRLNGNTIPYDSQDVGRVMDLWLSRSRLALPSMNISLYSAGHVLGANMVGIEAEGKKMLYTGDFCLHGTEILDGADVSELPHEPDVLIMESTYGGVTRPSRSELVGRLFNVITEAIEREGNVLIPTFAFHRTQEMAKRIDLAMRQGLIPRYNAYYISGLAHRINGLFNDYRRLVKGQILGQGLPFDYKLVRRLKRTEDIQEPAIVVCTSGFGHAGASRSLLVDWADGEDNSVVINTGYLPPDSPLLMAKEKRVVEGDDKMVPVKAKVEHVELSGHADQSELVEFVKELRPKRTFLVHGDLEQSQALARAIDRYTDTTIPEKYETIEV